MKWLGLVGLICLVVTAFATPAVAQNVKKVEVAGGWNYMAIKDNGDETWTHFPKGWFAEVAGNLSSMWSVVGLISGDYKTLTESDGDFNLKVYPYLFGIRASTRQNPKAAAFAHFLAGGTNVRVSQGSDHISDSYFTWAAGGGANVKINDKVGARVGADYIRVKGKEDTDLVTDTLQGIRLTAGVVVGFGGK